MLPPIDPSFDQVDMANRLGWGWWSAAAADFVALPLTAWHRLASLLRPLRPRGRYRYAHKIKPERYGAGRSLREGASTGLKASHWYQAADAAAIAAAVSRRLFDESASYLKARGYDVSQLRKDAATVIQNNSIKITGGQLRGDEDRERRHHRGRGEGRTRRRQEVRPRRTRPGVVDQRATSQGATYASKAFARALGDLDRVGVPDLLVEDLHLDVARVPGVDDQAGDAAKSTWPSPVIPGRAGCRPGAG